MLEFLAKLSRFIKDQIVGEPPAVPPPSPDSSSDLEYENLLWALLEEVEQGKSWGQLQGFLIANRLDAKRLARWLQSYGDRWLEQPEPNQELARRLVKLGQVGTRELGTVARVLGERLLVPPPSEVNSDNFLATGLGNSGAIAQSGDSDGREVDLDNLQPNNYEGGYKRGNALLDLGRLEEAISSFDQALKIKPDNHEAWFNQGIALDDLGRIEEAIFSYDQVLKIKPDNHEAWNNRGNALRNLGRIEEAISSLDQALKIKPDCHEAWNNRGIALEI